MDAGIKSPRVQQAGCPSLLSLLTGVWKRMVYTRGCGFGARIPVSGGVKFAQTLTRLCLDHISSKLIVSLRLCTGFDSEETEDATKLYYCVASAMVFLVRPAKCMPHPLTSKTLTAIPHQANPAVLASQVSLPALDKHVYIHYCWSITPSLLSSNWPNGPMARRLTTIHIRYQEIPGCKFHPFKQSSVRTTCLTHLSDPWLGHNIQLS
jgi:hypothetical protein